MTDYAFWTGTETVYLTKNDLRNHQIFRIKGKYFSFTEFCQIVQKATRTPTIVERDDVSIEIIFEGD